MRIASIATIILMTAAAPVATAATIIQSGSATNRVTGFYGKFDPSLGRLLSVSVTQQFSSSVTYQVWGSTASDFQVTLDGSLYTIFGGARFDNSFVRRFEPSAEIYVSVSDSKTVHNRFTESSDTVSQFIGVGGASVLFGGTVFTGIGALNGTNGFISLVRGFEPDSVSYTVKYDYVELGAVPEPSSWLLAVSGFLLLGLRLRRRFVPVQTAHISDPRCLG